MSYFNYPILTWPLTVDSAWEFVPLSSFCLLLSERKIVLPAFNKRELLDAPHDFPCDPKSLAKIIPLL